MVNEPLAEYRVRETSLASNRIRQFDAYVAVLEKAARRSDLSADERSALENSLRVQRRRLGLREAEEALAEARPEARRLALRVAWEGGYPLRTRARAALAASLPKVVASRLARSRRDLAAGVRAS
jgi:hypothetical protein